MKWTVLVCWAMLFACKKTDMTTASNASLSLTNQFYGADDPRFQYAGRIDFSNPALPRFWASGVYITATFQGRSCDVYLNDQASRGAHNYVTTVVDGGVPQRIKLTGATNIIHAAQGLDETTHTIVICKETEAGIGYMEFAGLKCNQLATPPPAPIHKMEFIGDSQTTGSAADASVIPCGTGQWYDQEDAYRSYGAVTARNLSATWYISAIAGIGMTSTCCNLRISMPEVFDKIAMANDSLRWDFTRYQPDVVTICLAQNGASKEPAAFSKAYVKFINTVRADYPAAAIICLSSPMGDASTANVLNTCINQTVGAMNKAGDRKVYKYFFSRQYHGGCAAHPSVQDHQLMATELTAFVRSIMHW